MRVRRVFVHIWNGFKSGLSLLRQCLPKRKARGTDNLTMEEVMEVLRIYEGLYQQFYERYYRGVCQTFYQRLYREIYQVRTSQSEDYWAWYGAYNGSDVVV